jgi:hypothetical protein
MGIQANQINLVEEGILNNQRFSNSLRISIQERDKAGQLALAIDNRIAVLMKVLLVMRLKCSTIMLIQLMKITLKILVKMKEKNLFIKSLFNKNCKKNRIERKKSNINEEL